MGCFGWCICLLSNTELCLPLAYPIWYLGSTAETQLIPSETLKKYSPPKCQSKTILKNSDNQHSQVPHNVVVLVISIKWYTRSSLPHFPATLLGMDHSVMQRTPLLSNKSGFILLLSKTFSKSKGDNDKLMCQTTSRLCFVPCYF